MFRTVLVTGGAGFIGSNLVRMLASQAEGSKIVCLDKLDYAGNLGNIQDLVDSGAVAFERADICRPHEVRAVLERHEPDLVLHLAAQTHVDRSILSGLAFVETNVLGTAVLVEACRALWGGRRNVRFVHVSTDEVYGPGRPEEAFDESAPYRPTSPYAASKAGADHMVDAAVRTWGFPALVVHPSNNYGPYQFPEKLIPLVIRNILADEPIPIYGKGDQMRDWLFVEDTCRGLLIVAERGEVGAHYNLATGRLTRNLELVERLCRLVDERLGQPMGTARKLVRHVADRPAHDVCYHVRADRARALGWMPAKDLEAGLAETVAWYLGHRDWVEEVTSGAYRDYYERIYGERLGRSESP